MKKLVIVVLLIGGATLGFKALAFSRLSDEQKASHITNKMARKLNLSKEQQEKVFELNLKRIKGHKEAHEMGNNKEFLVTVVKNWEQEMRIALTDEQERKIGIN